MKHETLDGEVKNIHTKANYNNDWLKVKQGITQIASKERRSFSTMLLILLETAIKGYKETER